jgi:D-3-phosphoglycerate dehydrogenase
MMKDKASLLWMTIDRHPDSLKDLIRQRLGATGWNIHEVSYEDIHKLGDLDLETVNGVLLAPARYIPAEYLARLTSCALMQVWSSGYDKFNLDDARKHDIAVANNHGANATSVAEHTMLLMLGVSRRAPEMHSRVIDGQWEGNDHGMNSYSLEGKTLGIVGMGRIGTRVAIRAAAFGMTVVFTDPAVTEAQAPTGAQKVTWESLLEISDYISLHVHHNDETRGMINQAAFSRMARRPFVINASRAELIDKPALLEALKDGIIRGLGIDAHYDEPTSAVDPLWTFDSVFASPHVAGSTVDSYRETIDACLENIARAVNGEKPSGLLF